MPPELLTWAGTVLGSSLVASLSYWIAKRKGTDEPFKPEKAAITITAAFAVAVALFATGQVTGQEDALTQLAFFVGPVAVWLQGLVKRYRSREYGTTAGRAAD